MCNSAIEWTLPSKTYATCIKRSKVRVQRLNRRKRIYEKKVFDKIMELKNLKLYMENLSILQENEKLRKKASLLHQENIALISEFRNKSTNLKSLPTSLIVKDTRIK